MNFLIQENIFFRKETKLLKKILKYVRLVADWANFRLLGDCLLGAVFLTYRSSPHFWTTFFHCKSDVLILTKNGLGYILGDFFTNSSGHLGWLDLNQRIHKTKANVSICTYLSKSICPRCC
jgi:hypothetical protein